MEEFDEQNGVSEDLKAATTTTTTEEVVVAGHTTKSNKRKREHKDDDDHHHHHDRGHKHHKSSGGTSSKHRHKKHKSRKHENHDDSKSRRQRKESSSSKKEKEERSSVVAMSGEQKRCIRDFPYWPTIVDPESDSGGGATGGGWTWGKEHANRQNWSGNASLKEAILRNKEHEKRNMLRRLIKRESTEELLEMDVVIDDFITRWFTSLTSACKSVECALRIVKELCKCPAFMPTDNTKLYESLIKQTQSGHYFVSVTPDVGTLFIVHFSDPETNNPLSQRFSFDTTGRRITSQQTRTRTPPNLDWKREKHTSSLQAIIKHLKDAGYVSLALTFPVSKR
mgnify:CR=1 FL=1